MNLFYKKNSISNCHIIPIFYLGYTNIGYYLSESEHFFLPRITGPACAINIYKTFQNVFVRNLGMSIWLSLYKHFDCYPNAE